MKCCQCGKEINEVCDKYHVFTLDGDFIHDKCEVEFNKHNQFEDLIEFIEETGIEELTEFLKSYGIRFENKED